MRRRTVVDGHEVDKVGRGEKRLVNRDLSQAVGPSHAPEAALWDPMSLSLEVPVSTTVF